MISIIIPIYNTAIYLKQCINSIINQTFKDIEIILVDDGSTDNSLDICYSFSRKDSRIKVYHKENTGVSATRNYGLSKASGDYISFCDSDDIISETLYELLYKKIEETNADRVVAGYQFLYPSGRVVKCIERKSDGLYKTKELLGEMIDDGTLSGFLFSGVNNSLFKKTIIDNYKIRFNENIKHNEDGLFSFEYALNSKLLYSMQSLPLYSYRQHDSSSSSKRKEDDMFIPMKDYLRLLQHSVNDFNLDIQLKRRNVTETLWMILDISKSESGFNAISDILNVIKKRKIANDFQYLRPDMMNRYKKIYLYLMKHNYAMLLFLLSKYILPIASKYLSR